MSGGGASDGAFEAALGERLAVLVRADDAPPTPSSELEALMVPRSDRGTVVLRRGRRMAATAVMATAGVLSVGGLAAAAVVEVTDTADLLPRPVADAIGWVGGFMGFDDEQSADADDLLVDAGGGEGPGSDPSVTEEVAVPLSGGASAPDAGSSAAARAGSGIDRFGPPRAPGPRSGRDDGSEHGSDGAPAGDAPDDAGSPPTGSAPTDPSPDASPGYPAGHAPAPDVSSPPDRPGGQVVEPPPTDPPPAGEGASVTGEPSGAQPSGGQPAGGGEPPGGQPSGGQPTGGRPSGGQPSGGQPTGGGHQTGGGQVSGGQPTGGGHQTGGGQVSGGQPTGGGHQTGGGQASDGQPTGGGHVGGAQPSGGHQPAGSSGLSGGGRVTGSPSGGHDDGATRAGGAGARDGGSSGRPGPPL